MGSIVWVPVDHAELKAVEASDAVGGACFVGDGGSEDSSVGAIGFVGFEYFSTYGVDPAGDAADENSSLKVLATVCIDSGGEIVGGWLAHGSGFPTFTAPCLHCGVADDVGAGVRMPIDCCEFEVGAHANAVGVEDHS